MSEQTAAGMERKFEYWLEHGTLIYASFLKHKVPTKMWGRLLKFETLKSGDISFSLFNEENKQTEQIRLSELDDFQAEEEPDVEYVTYYPGQGSQRISSIHGGETEPSELEEKVATNVAKEEPAAVSEAGKSRAEQLIGLLAGLSEEDIELLCNLARRLARG